MGKPSRPRALSDSQARAVGTNIRTSPRKLNLVAQSIRGQRAEVALATLNFSPKRIARDVKKVLQSAIANAENNHDLDVDDLVVTEASVGKNMVLSRFQARARGRGAAIEKPFSQITIVVEEKRAPVVAKEDKEDKKDKKQPKAKAPAPAKKKSRASAKEKA